MATGDPTECVIAVDLGGTKISAALVSRTGEVGAVVTVPTPAHEGPEAILDAVGEAVNALSSRWQSERSESKPRASEARSAPHDLRASASETRSAPHDLRASASETRSACDTSGFDSLRSLSQRGDTAPLALAIGTAGIVDHRGVVVSATDILPGWTGTDITAGIHARTGIPKIHVQNDVNAHAAGEAWLGAGRGKPCVLLVAVGTGVGGAIVLDGVPRRGAHHVGGEIGHHPTPGAEGLICGCGREGHLDAIAPGPMIARRYAALTGTDGDLDARAVFARAERGDGVAKQVIDDAARAVGRAIAGQVTVLDPDVVVIGGGLPSAGPRWWDPMEQTLRAELVDVLAGIPVVPAMLGQEAALVGAAYAAWQLVDDEGEDPHGQA
ncbi:ROK family protein [Mariniluteicoccus flavus]